RRRVRRQRRLQREPDVDAGRAARPLRAGARSPTRGGARRDGRARRRVGSVPPRDRRRPRRDRRPAPRRRRAGAALPGSPHRRDALARARRRRRGSRAPGRRGAHQGLTRRRSGRRRRPDRESRRGMVRVLIAGLVAMVIAVVIGPTFIDWLKRRSVGQQIRAEGPAGHHTKQGTPTMGGLLILFAALAPFFVLSVYTAAGLTMMGTVLGCGLIGLADDYLKVRRRRSLGLPGRWKMLGLLAVTVGVGF